MSAPLYNRDILALAVATADYMPLADASHRVSKRAPLCGSAIILDLDTDDAGRVARVGMHVEACALGQASATLLARHAPGLGLADLRAARGAIAGWFAPTTRTPSTPERAFWHWPTVWAATPPVRWPPNSSSPLWPTSTTTNPAATCWPS